MREREVGEEDRVQAYPYAKKPRLVLIHPMFQVRTCTGHRLLIYSSLRGGADIALDGRLSTSVASNTDVDVDLPGTTSEVGHWLRKGI